MESGSGRVRIRLVAAPPGLRVRQQLDGAKPHDEASALSDGNSAGVLHVSEFRSARGMDGLVYSLAKRLYSLYEDGARQTLVVVLDECGAAECWTSFKTFCRKLALTWTEICRFREEIVLEVALEFAHIDAPEALFAFLCGLSGRARSFLVTRGETLEEWKTQQRWRLEQLCRWQQRGSSSQRQHSTSIPLSSAESVESPHKLVLGFPAWRRDSPASQSNDHECSHRVFAVNVAEYSANSMSVLMQTLNARASESGCADIVLVLVVQDPLDNILSIIHTIITEIGPQNVALSLMTCLAVPERTRALSIWAPACSWLGALMLWMRIRIRSSNDHPAVLFSETELPCDMQDWVTVQNFRNDDALSLASKLRNLIPVTAVQAGTAWHRDEDAKLAIFEDGQGLGQLSDDDLILLHDRLSDFYLHQALGASRFDRKVALAVLSASQSPGTRSMREWFTKVAFSIESEATAKGSVPCLRFTALVNLRGQCTYPNADGKPARVHFTVRCGSLRSSQVEQRTGHCSCMTDRAELGSRENEKVFCEADFERIDPCTHLVLAFLFVRVALAEKICFRLFPQVRRRCGHYDIDMPMYAADHVLGVRMNQYTHTASTACDAVLGFFSPNEDGEEEDAIFSGSYCGVPYALQVAKLSAFTASVSQILGKADIERTQVLCKKLTLGCVGEDDAMLDSVRSRIVILRSGTTASGSGVVKILLQSRTTCGAGVRVWIRTVLEADVANGTTRKFSTGIGSSEVHRVVCEKCKNLPGSFEHLCKHARALVRAVEKRFVEQILLSSRIGGTRVQLRNAPYERVSSTCILLKKFATSAQLTASDFPSFQRSAKILSQVGKVMKREIGKIEPHFARSGEQSNARIQSHLQECDSGVKHGHRAALDMIFGEQADMNETEYIEQETRPKHKRTTRRKESGFTRPEESRSPKLRTSDVVVLDRGVQGESSSKLNVLSISEDALVAALLSAGQSLLQKMEIQTTQGAHSRKRHAADAFKGMESSSASEH
ncbi:hypothetical protein FVE85_7266 [Porphyridium purpureum]|uniref:Uncharacterized protein n=1 Tax=Porphyridium purpureum TaxID=35688 RepID=A0A5J4Z6Z1_PORPP|nr:hypothetical protein FVE85_7266 [Porphyridium purpureum]|eukprot:POR8158..scf295_1